MAGLQLSQYLASLRTRTWQPGALDCGVFMADWVRHVCGIDPIADVRGTYATERAFRRIVRREGGLARSCAGRLATAGMVETRAPESGDIAVVLAPFALGKLRPTGSICISKTLRAVITSDLGLVICVLPTIRTWTFDAA